MKSSLSAAAFVPADRSLAALRVAAATCQGCDLYLAATQTVFGAGRVGAPLMLVGEQPGDKEDLAGQPFIGPAGKLLDSALRAAGIARDDAYVTNAVKHFKFVERGKRRIHAKPKTIEIRACAPWLDAEIEAVSPQLIVALGATAALALFGPSFRLTRERGRIIDVEGGPPRLATVHPSSILRAVDEAARETELQQMIADLRVAARLLGESSSGASA